MNIEIHEKVQVNIIYNYVYIRSNLNVLTTSNCEMQHFKPNFINLVPGVFLIRYTTLALYMFFNGTLYIVFQVCLEPNSRNYALIVPFCILKWIKQ